METEDVLPSLFHAYEKEETLFVRSDFLKAIARLDYTLPSQTEGAAGTAAGGDSGS